MRKTLYLKEAIFSRCHRFPQFDHTPSLCSNAISIAHKAKCQGEDFVSFVFCIGGAGALCFVFNEPLIKRDGNVFVHETGDVAAKASDFLNKARRDRLILCFGHQKHGLDSRIKRAVHAHHLKLVLEIRNSPKPPNDEAGGHILSALDQQIAERMNSDLRFGRLGDPQADVGHHFHPFFERKQRLLVGIDGNADNEVIDKGACPFENVDMTEGDWVKRPWIKSCAHERLLPPHALMLNFSTAKQNWQCAVKRNHVTVATLPGRERQILRS